MHINKMLSIVLILFTSYSMGLAQDYRYEDENPNTEESFSPYHAGIFLGATSNFEHNSTDFTLGLDYEYRLPWNDNLYGVGIFVEGIFAEQKESLLGFPIFIHPNWAHFKFWIAPGVAFGDELVVSEGQQAININKGDVILSEDGPAEETKFNFHFLFRLGMGYDYHIDIFSLSPSVSLDIIGGNLSLIYGVTFGMEF